MRSIDIVKSKIGHNTAYRGIAFDRGRPVHLFEADGVVVSYTSDDIYAIVADHREKESAS